MDCRTKQGINITNESLFFLDIIYLPSVRAFIPHPATFLNQERYFDELDISFGEDFVKEKLWHETWSGIVTKGQENGIKEEDFEDPQDFKRAVFKKCKPELKVA